MHYKTKYLLNRTGNSSRVTQECHECNKHEEIWHASQALTGATVILFCKNVQVFWVLRRGLSWEKSLLEQKQLILRSFCLTAKPRVATRASGANGAVSSGGAFFCFFLPFGARQICHETNHWNQRQATKWMPFLHLQYFLFAATAFETRCNCTYYRVSQQVLGMKL